MKKILEEIKRLFVKEKKNITVAMISGLVFTLCFSIINYTRTYALTVQSNIANEVVRFHVLANSNSKEDQELKVYVKDKVLEKFKNELVNIESREEALLLMEDNIEEIEAYAKKIIRRSGYDYDVSVRVKKVDFPTKIYGDIKLPAGNYTALQIEIGNAVGENWWCVMYPPLCYVDVTKEATTTLKSSLTEEEFTLITEDSNKVELEFKLVEYWNKLSAK